MLHTPFPFPSDMVPSYRRITAHVGSIVLSLVRFLIYCRCIDWVCFLVLDIGNPAIESIPVGTRILDGLMQGIAVRGAGFGIVNLAALAPAVKVLYVVMMYISICKSRNFPFPPFSLF